MRGEDGDLVAVGFEDDAVVAVPVERHVAQNRDERGAPRTSRASTLSRTGAPGSGGWTRAPVAQSRPPGCMPVSSS
ncbi:hypothetical protein ABT403_29100 [Streptomyces sp. NPDC000075]|uniref:hypothetical protein n=1 Tax=Streptomyces TaxID=1883 RepID=UPI0031DC6FCD